MYEKKNKINDMTKVSHLYNSLNDNKSKIIPFKIVFGNVGNIRYFPPATREWKNSVYSYNQNYMKNLPIYNIIINNLIKNYFNLSFKREFLGAKYIHIPEFLKKKRFSLRKIFVSKAEVKHTNSKALINIFIYNKQKKYYWNYIVGIFLFIYIKIYRIPLFRHLYLPYKSCILKYLHFLANYLFKRDHINPIKKGFIHLNMGKMKIMLKNKYKYKKINNQWVLGNQKGKLLMRLELSNSGEALKLWLPRKGTKAICKWINNPLAVTRSKMMKTEIGNHGSKSIIVVYLITTLVVVKEQRVDGSWWEKYRTIPNKPKCISHLRCTLMGFERNYQDSTHSNTIHISRGFSTRNKKIVLRSSLKNFKLDPNWVTGFVDGEGCFHVSIIKNKNYKLGWQVQLGFTLGLHVKDKGLMEDIKKFLKVGNINFKHGPQSIQLSVKSLKEFETVIIHFDKFPLNTQKQADYKALKLAYFIIKNKEHLTKEGLRKIVAIKASMNLGLSDKLTKAFSDVIPVKRPLVELPQTIDPHWLAGFVSGEGYFMIKIRASKKYSVGFQVILVFVITQHLRDQQLLICIKEYLGCGNVYQNREAFDYRVTKFKDIEEKIIPFFTFVQDLKRSCTKEKYKIQGVKALDFADWCRAAELMKNQKHLTAEGLEEIKQIKAGMNTGRKN